jgi:hypothetical protein
MGARSSSARCDFRGNTGVRWYGGFRVRRNQLLITVNTAVTAPSKHSRSLLPHSALGHEGRCGTHVMRTHEP